MRGAKLFRKAGTWQKLSPSGSSPPGRLYSEAMWSQVMDGFYIFSGQAASGNLNDIWFYSRQATVGDSSQCKEIATGQQLD